MSHDTKQTAAEYERTGAVAGAVEWATRNGERVGDALLYSSAYLAAVAMVEVAVAMLLLSLPPNPAPVVGGLLTFAVYAVDRVVDTEADRLSVPERAAFVRRHRNELYLLAAVAYGAAVSLSLLGGPLAFAIALLPGASWILYGADWLPDVAFGVGRVKEVLVVNSAVVALTWATGLTFLPLAFADAAPSPAVLAVFAYFFLRSFVDTEVPNVRDVDADLATGAATLPAVYGVAATRRLLLAVEATTFAVVAVAVVAGTFPPAVGAALAVGVVYSGLVVCLLGRVGDGWLLLATEAEYVLVTVALVVALSLA